MRELIEYLIKHLVNKPDQIIINEVSGEKTSILQLWVADGDMGQVIGRKGKIVESLRHILTAAAARQGKRYILEILENEKPETAGS